MFIEKYSSFVKTLLVVFAICCLSSCSAESSGGLGTSCTADLDCNDGLACNSMGQCITVECTTAAHCPDGKVCSPVSHTCIDADTADGDQPSTGCTIDEDCPFGFMCVYGGTCVEIEGACRQSADCPAGQYCADGICKNRSEADVDLATDGDDADSVDDVDSSDGDIVEQEDLLDTDNDGIPDIIEDKNDNGVYDAGLETDFNDADTDDDGLDDGIEDANRDGIWQLTETDPRMPDTDIDKLSDGEEDFNKNGVVDAGETDPRKPDTDNDGVIDGNEISWGYGEPPAYGSNSDPLNKDSDGDTLPDGVEDSNGNGKYEPELGETDPTRIDSDGDGEPDNEESVAQICQEDQVTVISLHDSPDGDWTLALLPSIFSTVNMLQMNPGTGQQLVAASFEDSTNNMAGFILSRTPSSQVATEQVANDNTLLAELPPDNVLNHRGRTYTSPDEFDSMTSHYTVKFTSNKSVGEVRNQALALLSAKSVGDITNLEAGPAEQGNEFELVLQTLVRADKVIVLAAVLTRARYDNAAAPQARINTVDLTDGTSIRKSQKTTTDGCDPMIGSSPSLVDFLWVVDDSGSMDEDQQAVADAAQVFATVMTNAGIDFRVAVTSTACVFLGNICPWYIELFTPELCVFLTNPDNSGVLGSAGFTNNMTAFQSDVQNPPCGGAEYGLMAGEQGLTKAMDTTLAENLRLRPDASRIIIWLSDEEDQEYENCNDASCENNTVTYYKNYFTSVEATCFAIVGDAPNGCGGGSPDAGQGAGEAGVAYIDVAYHTGGSFASICSSDLTPTMEEILRSAAGTASDYILEYRPITSTLQVMIEGTIIARDPLNGFEYDAASNAVVFYGDSIPEDGNDVVISYRYFSDDVKPD